MLTQKNYKNLYGKVLSIKDGIVETDGPFNIRFGELVSFKNHNNKLFGMYFKHLSIQKQQLKIFFNCYYFIFNKILFNLSISVVKIFIK